MELLFVLRDIKKEAWIPVPDITPQHVCCSPKPGSEFIWAHVVVINLVCSLIYGGVVGFGEFVDHGCVTIFS
jgi:hypothetical protein